MERGLFGSKPAAFVVEVHAPLRSLRVELRAPGVEPIARSIGQRRPGSTIRVELRFPKAGEYAFSGELRARFADGREASMPLSFSAESLAPLDFVAHATPESIADGSLRVEADAPLARYELTLYGRKTAPLGHDAGRLSSDGRIAWQPPEGEVLRVELTVFDEVERFRSVTLYPWRVDVPHEEVHFATGSAAIPASEAGKLEASLAALEKTIADYGRWAPVKLYIAGHTDTVGSARSNLVLSQHRARAIARWFRSHGVRVPILFAGMGEGALAVRTPDETNEVANRRAEYIVSVEPPPGRTRWVRVQ